MRVAYSLGSLLSVKQVLKCANLLAGTDADTVWIPETWGMENFSMLGAISNMPGTYKIGSSIINIYSRSPATIAMGAATIDMISQGRLVLGLGTSSVPIVEDLHGYKFERPVDRMREYVEIIRKMISSRRADHSGRIFSLKNFSLLIKPFRSSIPIYLAAVNKNMMNLTWEIADGAILYLRPLEEIRQTVSSMQSRRKIDVSCQIITCVAEDPDAALLRAKKTLAFYISVGRIYREFLMQNGFLSETKNVFEEFKKSGLESNHEMITDRMLDSLVIAGTPDQCLGKLEKFRSAGIDLPIMQFNPVGNVMESFGLFTRTFSGAKN